MRFSTLGLILGFLFLVSCGKKSEDHSNVRIQLDSSIFTGTGETQAKVSASATADGTSTDGPDWGLVDPTDLSEIKCWGVFVGGPDNGLNNSSCTLGSGKVFRFGPRAGFYPIDQEGSVQVPAGNDRVFFLAGMASATGRCDLGFDKNADVNFSNYSAPFILGSVGRISITQNNQRVNIPINNAFTSDNRLESCDFVKPQNPVQFMPFQSNRSTWVRENTLPRTVQFQHNGVKVQCSFDEGITYGNCNSSGQNFFVWEPDAGFNKDYYVKVYRADGTSIEATFNPQNYYNRSINFVSCNSTLVSSTTYDSAGLGTSINNNSNVLCINPGVKISDGSSIHGFVQTGTGVTVISPQRSDGAKATFEQNNSYVIANLYGQNNKFVGINFVSNASGNSVITFPSGVDDYIFDDCSIEMNNTGNSLAAIGFSPSTMSNPVQLLFSSVVHRGPGYGIQTAVGARLVVRNSFLSGKYNTLKLSSIYADIQDSFIHSMGQGSPNYAAYVYSPPTGHSINLSNNIFAVEGESALGVEGGPSGTNNADVELSANFFVRLDRSGTDAGAIAVNATSSAGPENVNNNNGPNTFCAQKPSSHAFIDILAGTQTGNWTDANQILNGGGITASDCALYPEVIKSLERFGF